VGVSTVTTDNERERAGATAMLGMANRWEGRRFVARQFCGLAAGGSRDQPKVFIRPSASPDQRGDAFSHTSWVGR
jgi:hypothetical protein